MVFLVGAIVVPMLFIGLFYGVSFLYFMFVCFYCEADSFLYFLIGVITVFRYCICVVGVSDCSYLVYSLGLDVVSLRVSYGVL
jgi:hypothetical protein